MARLKPKETARWVSCIPWVEDLEREYGANYYGMLIGFLASLNVPVAVSPVHDKDWYTYEDVRKWIKRRFDPDNYEYMPDMTLEEIEDMAPKVGDLKKPHIHVLFRMPARRNRQYYTELVSDFMTIPETKWERVDDIDKYTCYLVHLYNEDKFHYPITSVLCLSGFDGSALLDMTDNERENVYDYINEQIHELGLRYYYQLNTWANECDSPRVKSIVRGNHGYFAAIFRSLREHKYDDAAIKKAKAEAAKG